MIWRLFKPLKDGYHPVEPQICLIPFKIFVQFSISGIKSWYFLFCYNPHHSSKKNPKRPNISLSSSNFLYFVVLSIVRTHFSYYFLLFISLYFLLILSLYFLYFHFSFPFFSYFFSFLFLPHLHVAPRSLLDSLPPRHFFSLTFLSIFSRFLYFQTSFHVVLFFFFYLFLILSFFLRLHGNPPLPPIHFCHCRPPMT